TRTGARSRPGWSTTPAPWTRSSGRSTRSGLSSNAWPGKRNATRRGMRRAQPKAERARRSPEREAGRVSRPVARTTEHDCLTPPVRSKSVPDFELVTPMEPAGDQPEAIAALGRGLENGDRFQTLLGITGSGKS